MDSEEGIDRHRMAPILRHCCLIGLLGVLMSGIVAAKANATVVYEAYPSSANDGNLFIREDGEDPRLLPIWVQEPALAPDGKRIVYKDSGGLFVTDINGATPRQVFAGQPCHDAAPQWAPDGRSVIACVVTGGSGQIYEFRITLDGWVSQPVIDWAGGQGYPTISPDGGKVAFTSYSDPQGNSFPSRRPALFVANRDGSAPIQLTEPDYANYCPDAINPYNASFSSDGDEIVFYGWGCDDAHSEIWTAEADTGDLTQLTSNDFMDWYPRWGADGRIVFWQEYEDDSAAIVRLDPNTSQIETLEDFSPGDWEWIQVSSAQASQPLAMTQAEADRALAQFAPTLSYDDGEQYFTISANSITDVHGLGRDGSNLVRRDDGTPIAYADPTLSNPALSLDLLDGVQYGNGAPVLGTDRLSERNHWTEDAAALQADPGYANRIYGRAVYDQGRWWLQYWLWYYYQNFLAGSGDHEGDWELMQLGLDAFGTPEVVTYAQHGDQYADACPWEDVHWELGYYSNVSPIGYVADGSHATYLRPGTFIGDPVPVDAADGDGPTGYPQVLPMGDGSSGWLAWPGIWGDSGTSPGGPKHQTLRWEDPAAFHTQAQQNCPSAGGASPLGPFSFPEPPVLSAQLQGDRVAVSYELPDHGVDPAGLRLTISAKDQRVTPTGDFYRLRRQDGILVVPLPDGRGPYTVRGSAITDSGMRSHEVELSLP